MGFSLEAFITDLRCKLREMSGLTQQEIVDEIIETIDWWEDYAKQCGNIGE